MSCVNAIWITENKKQLEMLYAFKRILKFNEAVLESECEISALPGYDMVFFLLTPNRIGNAFFIQAIEEVMRIRRNSKTLFFLIDEIFRLDEQELVQVMLEMKASVGHLIQNPAVYAVSTYYALLHHQYENGVITLEDIRHNRDVLIPDGENGLVTGRQLTEEHARQLLSLSRMDRLYPVIERFTAGLSGAGIDAAKRNWLVTGPHGTGKSLIVDLMQTALDSNACIHFTDMDMIPEEARRYYDGVIIVIDPDIHQSTAYLEHMGSSFAAMENVIVVNKYDTHMYFGQDQSKLQANILSSLRSLTGAPVYFVSAYYFRQYVRLDRQEASLEDIIQDPQIVLADSMHFPLAKEKCRTALQDLLLTQSGFNDLLHNWE